MKYAVLFLALLLPACASDRMWGIFGKPADEVKEHRKIDSKPPLEPQPAAPVEAQPPPPGKPAERIPKKRGHNIEED